MAFEHLLLADPGFLHEKDTQESRSSPSACSAIATRLDVPPDLPAPATKTTRAARTAAARAVLEKTADLVDIAEVGTPLVLREGAAAIRVLKRDFPGLSILADFKIMDAGAEVMADLIGAADPRAAVTQTRDAMR